MKTIKKVFFSAAIASLAFVSCKEEKIKEEKSAGIVLENMDTSVKPTDDFFRHVNGTWLDKQGKAPVMPYLAKVDEIKTKKDVETYLTNMAPYGGGGFYGFGVYNDLKNSSQYAGYMGGGSLGLSRDYYVDAAVKDKLDKYQEFMAKMLQEFGDDEATAKKNAATIVDFETSLAKPMMTKEESRDIRKLYNPMSIAELQDLAPAIDWQAHLDGIGVVDLDTIIVTDLGYFKAMSNIFEKRSVEDIKLLLRWNTINNSLGSLSTDLETANWEFYSKEMRGAT